MAVLHGMNPVDNEFTMCSLAFDAYDSGDHDEPIVMASSSQIVTCPECRRVAILWRSARIGRTTTTKAARAAGGTP